ncbi:MAG TPA: nucleotidyltransferase domain-containing protein [Lichenihabitans sp.]|jgi:hypothetical protein|nr:nucleotidyltransferase domain-containing protein [Lichenihabitans sp.]
MDRSEIITRLKAAEPQLRARGVAALYLFGSYGRDEAGPRSDIDLFVDAGHERLYDLSNYMGAYAALRSVLPNFDIGYSTRDGLADQVRAAVEREAVRVF